MFGQSGRRNVTVVCLVALTCTMAVYAVPPLDNVRGGSLAERAPGNMVRDGVARTLEAAAFARYGVEITDTYRPTTVRAQLMTEVISIVFNQINLAVVAFHNLLLARAGEAPIVPDTIVPAVIDQLTNDSSSTDGSLDFSDLNISDLIDSFTGS